MSLWTSSNSTHECHRPDPSFPSLALVNRTDDFKFRFEEANILSSLKKRNPDKHSYALREKFFSFSKLLALKFKSSSLTCPFKSLSEFTSIRWFEERSSSFRFPESLNFLKWDKSTIRLFEAWSILSLVIRLIFSRESRLLWEISSTTKFGRQPAILAKELILLWEIESNSNELGSLQN